MLKFKKKRKEKSTHIHIHHCRKKRNNLHWKLFINLAIRQGLKFIAVSHLTSLIARKCYRDITFQQSAIDHVRVRETRRVAITLD